MGTKKSVKKKRAKKAKVHPRNRHAKGYTFEVEVNTAATQVGLPAARCWGSDGRARGLPEYIDNIIAREHFQCKRRAVIPQWMIPKDDCMGVITRADAGEAYAIIRLSDLFHYLQLKQAQPSPTLTSEVTDVHERSQEAPGSPEAGQDVQNRSSPGRAP